MIPLYVGYDPREASVYHVFCQSVIQHSTRPVMFVPLHQPMLQGFDSQQDGTNAFVYSRYLVPYLQGFHGPAIFVDGDMIVREDVNNLIELFDPNYAVQVVKHEYTTQHKMKYIGSDMQNENVQYPRKNWSSVMIFNCEHPSNKILLPEFVESAGGAFLHRFQWLNDDEIGDLPVEWNWLVREYEPNDNAKLLHWTLGSPGIEHYMRDQGAWEWNAHLLDALNMAGERPEAMVSRAQWRSHRKAS